MVEGSLALQVSLICTVEFLLLRLGSLLLCLLLRFLLPLHFLLFLLRLLSMNLLCRRRRSSVKLRPVLQDVKGGLHDLLVIQFRDLILDLLLDEVLDCALDFAGWLLLQL